MDFFYVAALAGIALFSLSASLFYRRRWLSREKQYALLKEREARFSESEGKYSMLVENVATGILLPETDGEIAYANPAFADIVGVGSPEALIGSSYLDFVHPEDRDESRRRMQLRTSEQKLLPLRVHRMLGPGGKESVVESTAAIAVSDGRPLVMSFFHDITERKRNEDALRGSEETFRTFFEQHGVGFAITDADCRWLNVNDRLCEILGYSREELRSIPWRDITPKDIFEQEIVRIGNALAHEDRNEHDFEKQFVRKDGSLIDVAVSTKILSSSGGEIRFASIVQDITDRKRSSRMLEEKARELERHREAIITSMAVLSEFRDGETGEHVRRTKEYVLLLLERADAVCPERFRGERRYPREDFGLISSSAVLHDIGKVGVPDSILLKPGPLTPEEFETIRTHPIIGSYALRKAETVLKDAEFLKYAHEIVTYHHEKWDGTGYPYGIAGEAIPFSARIMAVADVYDALVTERLYKKAFPHGQAVEIIASESGKHFDPELVKVFLECAEEFRAISER
jgi:PAS domain S-box-containing protein